MPSATRSLRVEIPLADYVLDASVAIEYLLETPTGLEIADLLGAASLVAPEIFDAEVMSSLRRGVLSGQIEEIRAQQLLDVLLVWTVERVSLRSLLPLAWEHYQNVTAYDAFYVAAARVEDVPLLTADGRLSRAPGLGITIQDVRMG